jgi:hypothetical protein
VVSVADLECIEDGVKRGVVEKRCLLFAKMLIISSSSGGGGGQEVKSVGELVAQARTMYNTLPPAEWK